MPIDVASRVSPTPGKNFNWYTCGKGFASVVTQCQTDFAVPLFGQCTLGLRASHAEKLRIYETSHRVVGITDVKFWEAWP